MGPGRRRTAGVDPLQQPTHLAGAQLKHARRRRQRHAAITENKRLGDVLAYIKERQEQQTQPAVKTNSEKNGYKPRGRKPGKRTDFMNDPVVIARREQALSRLDAAE